LKDAGKASVSVKQLDKYMRNTHNTEFSYDVLKAVYDADPRLKSIITNFDKEKIEFKQSEVDDVKSAGQPGRPSDTVGKMAKNATDLGS
jgi:hypothetical protein